MGSTDIYLTIVKNGILVDVQDADILYQIFTKEILQRDPEHEAPFIETIQRMCAQKPGEKIKPGCGGFGIRNFLALFLSIEMDKAFAIQAEGAAAGDENKTQYGKKMVQAYTDQMNESNPILTAIAEGMTAEGKCKDALANAKTQQEKIKLYSEQQKWVAFKEEQNKLLKDCSAKWNQALKDIRLDYAGVEAHKPPETSGNPAFLCLRIAEMRKERISSS